jgi:hypothetical protein
MRWPSLPGQAHLRMSAIVPALYDLPNTYLFTTMGSSAQLDFGLEEHVPISAIGARTHCI